MKRTVQYVLVVAASMLGALCPTVASPANAAQVAATDVKASDPRNVHCVMILEAVKPGSRSSRIADQKCGKPGEPAPLAAAETRLLMTWYKARDFGGSSTKIYGKDGGCGEYGIEYVGDGWNDKIRSYRAWNNCGRVSAYSNAIYGGTCWQMYSQNAYLGPVISSFWLSSRNWYC